MIRAITPVAALLIGVAILLTGQGLQGILLPVRANLEGFSTVAVGLIGATYFLGFTAGCWKGASFIQRVGHVRVFAAMTASASAVPLLHGLWVNLWTWALLRFVTGFCFAVLYVVIESWLNEQSSNENRGRIFSVYVLINMTVLAVGQQALLLQDPMQLHLFAVASVLVSLAAVPVALSTSQTPRFVESARLDFRRAFSVSPSGMLGSLSSGLANGAFWSLVPVFIAGLSDDISLVAWFMTAVVLGGAAGQFPLGLASDHTDRRHVLVGTALAGMVAGILIWLLAPTQGVTGMLLLGFCWGVAAFPLYSISVAHANDRAEPDDYVMLSSALLMMYGMGAVLGPFLAALMMTWLGGSGLYLFTSLIQGGFVIYLVVFSLRRRRAAPDQTVDFSDSLTTALTASRVYEEELAEEESS
jgi:MFS family permease